MPTRTQPILEIRQLSKQFGQTAALSGIDLTVRQGEVHALLGHNGSGKSTTIKIISGVLPPDSGDIILRGAHGNEASVGVVHQDLGLCADATVLENCGMTQYKVTRFGTIDWDAERALVEPILKTLEAGFDSQALVRHLSPADQTIVAIARALKAASNHGKLDLLILDEATARLRGKEAEKVLATARKVAEQGGGVLLVTHHMNEVMQVADRATVLRNGRVAGIVKVTETGEEELLALASGRSLFEAPGTQTTASITTLDAKTNAPTSISPSAPVAAKASPGQEGRPKQEQSSEQELFRAEEIVGTHFASVKGLTINSGEIVGMTGAPGSGYEEVPYLLALAYGKANIYIQNKRISGKGAHTSRRLGVGLVPADRLAQGVLLQATIRENISPAMRVAHLRKRLLSTSLEKKWAKAICHQFEIQPAKPDVPIATLSGGNQQKALLARVLEDAPKILLLHEPTEGVDETTRRKLAETIKNAARSGMGVLYVSADFEEVAELADRVLVIRDGEIKTEIPKGAGLVDRIYAASYLSHEHTKPKMANG